MSISNNMPIARIRFTSERGPDKEIYLLRFTEEEEGERESEKKEGVDEEFWKSRGIISEV